MIVLWATLLVLQGGHSLVPVMTVELGEPATVTCILPVNVSSGEELHWYKQRPADNLKLIVILWLSRAQYSPEFSPPRLEAIKSNTLSNLTILKTRREDEGIYHCSLNAGFNSVWSGTYLSVKGNSHRTLNYSVVQSSTVSGPVRPGDSVSLQCSVLSDSNKICPGRPSVYWIKTRSDKSGSGIVYTDVNDACEQRSDSVKTCVYRFSKNVSSSDAGTYHCAVATCGHILFGDGTKLSVAQEVKCELNVLVPVTVCLIISVIGNIFFFCYHTPLCGKELETKNVSSQAKLEMSNLPPPDNTKSVEDLNYAALHFSGGKKTRGRKKRELEGEECLYSDIRY